MHVNDRDDEARKLVTVEPASALAEDEGEPPVVARLVIEIRSDGRRTIARGAAEDRTLGQKVAVQAEGTTPLALALSLAKTVFSLPSLARTGLRSMLPSLRGKRDDDE
jgi:hypothetical protein